MQNKEVEMARTRRFKAKGDVAYKKWGQVNNAVLSAKY